MKSCMMPRLSEVSESLLRHSHRAKSTSWPTTHWREIRSFLRIGSARTLAKDLLKSSATAESHLNSKSRTAKTLQPIVRAKLCWLREQGAIRDQRSPACFWREVIRPKLLSASSMSEAVSLPANSYVSAQRSPGRLTCEVQADAMRSAAYSGDAYSVNPNVRQSEKTFLVADFVDQV